MSFIPKIISDLIQEQPICYTDHQIILFRDTLQTKLEQLYPTLNPYEYRNFFFQLKGIFRTNEQKKKMSISEAFIALLSISNKKCSGKFHCNAMALANAYRHYYDYHMCYNAAI